LYSLSDAIMQNMRWCYIHILSGVSAAYCPQVIWIGHKCSNCLNPAVRTHTAARTVRTGCMFGFLIFWRWKQQFIIIWLYHHKSDTKNILVPAAPIPVSPSNPPLFHKTSPLEVSSHCWPTVSPEVVVYHFQQAQKGHLSLLESKWSVETVGSSLDGTHVIIEGGAG